MTLRELINKIDDNIELDYNSPFLDREVGIYLNYSNSSIEMLIQEVVSAEKIYIAIGRPFQR